MEQTLDGYQGAVMLVADHPWPVRSGSQARAATIAEALRAHGPLTVLSLSGPEGSEGWREAAGAHRHRRSTPWLRVRDVTASLVAGKHAVLSRAEAAGLPEALAAELEARRPSVVVLGKPFWGRFIDIARRTSCVVIDADESLELASRSIAKSGSRASARLRALVELHAVRRLERRDLPRADQVWLSTEVERRWVATWMDEASAAVVPNASSRMPPEPPTPPRVTAIGFVGYFEHAPNEEAALDLIRNVMPVVRASSCPLRLMLIGRGPTERMRRAAGSANDIVITGEVNDPTVTLREAGILIMPIRTGGGSRVKAVEAIAAGVPIVSTRFGVEGLGLTEGLDYMAAETPAEFSDAVARLAADAGQRASLVACAYRSALATHSLEAVASAVRESLHRCR